jgi:hypothetical protein
MFIYVVINQVAEDGQDLTIGQRTNMHPSLTASFSKVFTSFDECGYGMVGGRSALASANK